MQTRRWRMHLVSGEVFENFMSIQTKEDMLFGYQEVKVPKEVQTKTFRPFGKSTTTTETKWELTSIAVFGVLRSNVRFVEKYEIDGIYINDGDTERMKPIYPSKRKK